MHAPPITRRRAAGLLGASILALTRAAHGQEVAKKFVFGQPGGASTDATTEAFIKPFQAATGISVELDIPSSFGKLRAMVESGHVTDSLWDLGSLQVQQAIALNLIEKIDWDEVNPQPMFPEMRQEYAFGQSYFSTVMGWAAGAKQPKSWVDFWDVANFPGKRSLSNFPTYTIPCALLADGVPADKLYPLDLDRAFKSLDRIKQNVSVWWTTGAQPGQLLLDKEVQYANAWSGRLAVLWNDGVRHSFDQGLLDISFYVVPRGAPPAEKRAAMKFLHDWTDPAKQVTFAKLVFYTGNSPNLAPLLPQDKMFLFPTTPENKAKQVLQDSKWWYDNAAIVEKRWQAWKLTASQ